MNKTNLALKITNWCNLHCNHCCENSGPKEQQNLMPIKDVERYTSEFCGLGIPQWHTVVFTGGEVMAPYYSDDFEYIPTCLDIAGQYKLTPVLKTNALWADDSVLLKQILTDIAKNAYNYDRRVVLDVSLDEFHDNIIPVATLIVNIIQNPIANDTIQLNLAGLRTEQSLKPLYKLLGLLEANGWHCRVARARNTMNAPDKVISITHKDEINNPRGYRNILVYFGTAVLENIGRAKDNNLSEYVSSGVPDSVGNCLQIDNNGIASLNYVWKTPVSSNKLSDIVNTLSNQMLARTGRSLLKSK